MERFWSKVNRLGPDDCWDWTAGVGARGYGNFKLRGRTRSSHRVAWFLQTGEWASRNVLHTCDNKKCCNPSHLYEGTDQQNVDDAVSRDQHPRGERHGRAKINDASVREMRQRYESGESFASLGRVFGLSDWSARRVCLRKTWKHVQ